MTRKVLRQHPDRIFKEPRHGLHLRLGGFGSVADVVVNGDGGLSLAAQRTKQGMIGTGITLNAYLLKACFGEQVYRFFSCEILIHAAFAGADGNRCDSTNPQNTFDLPESFHRIFPKVNTVDRKDLVE